MYRLMERVGDVSLPEVKRGYVEERQAFRCLICGKVLEKGIIYPYEHAWYEAERFMRVHIEHAHESVFAHLVGLDKKLTGLTDHQSELLRLFYLGKSDQDVQAALEIGSAATVRHHRFALKEKERQAKVFLAMMELVREREQQTLAFVTPHKAGQLVQEDTVFDEAEQREMLRQFFPHGVAGPLAHLPETERERAIVLRELAKRLDGDVAYGEVLLDELLRGAHENVEWLKKLLLDYGLIGCARDGGQYWLK